MRTDELTIVTSREVETGDLWAEVNIKDTVVARVKFSTMQSTTWIKFLTVHPHFERRGIGRHIVEVFQSKSDEVIAQGVRYSARRFWEKVGFEREEKNYRWTAR